MPADTRSHPRRQPPNTKKVKRNMLWGQGNAIIAVDARVQDVIGQWKENLRLFSLYFNLAAQR